MPDSLKFQLDLVDRMTKPGKEMEAQLKKLKLQLGAAEKEVRKTEQALAKLQKGKIVDIASYRKLTGELEHNKSAVAGFRDAILGTAQPLEDSNDNMTAAVTKGTLLANAYMKVAEYAAKAAVAIAGMAFKGMELAINASEAKNDTLDALDAFLGTADEVDYVYNSIEEMGSRVAISQEKGRQMAVELAAAGVTNSKLLVDAIQSIGQVSSILGEGAGAKIQSIIERSQASGKFELKTKQLAGTGVSNDMVAKAMGLTPKQMEAQMKAGQISAEKGLAALTKAIDQKFAGVAGKQVLDFGAQMQQAKDNFSRLFEDVKVEGFLSALHDILSILDQNTAAGKALKYVVDTVFSGLFAVVETVAPFVKAFLKGLVIIALQIYIAFKPLVKVIKEAFGGDNQKSVDGLASGMSKFGEILGQLITAGMPLFIGMFKYAMALWGAIKLVVGVVWDFWTAYMGVFTQVFGFFATVVAKFYDFGANIVNGLVDGIKSMINAPVDTIKSMANGALDAFTGIFKMHSPSKVMEEKGGFIMKGLDQGIDKNADAPAATLAEAVSPPPSASGSGSKGGSGGGVTITMGPGAVVISGVSNAQQLQDLFPGMLADAAEKLMLSVGAAA